MARTSSTGTTEPRLRHRLPTLSSDRGGEEVDDRVVVRGRIGVVENVAHPHGITNLDDQAGLFEYLPSSRLSHGLTSSLASAGDGPVIDVRPATAPNQQYPAIVDDHGTDTRRRMGFRHGRNGTAAAPDPHGTR